MTTPPPSEPNIPIQEQETSLENLQEQHLTLKLEVEQLYRDVARLRRWFQTLGTGLIVAILAAIVIVSWFAYRLLLQQKIAQLEVEKTAATKKELRGRLEQLEGQLQIQSEQVQNLREQVPFNLSELLRENQQQLQQLQEQFKQTEIKANHQKTAQ